MALITALGIAGVFSAGAMRAASADVDEAQQKLYLDPQTGEVVDAPPGHANADGDRSAGGDAARRSAPAEDEAWTNDEGAEMLTPAPGSAPTTQAVRCKDGTLRMGHTSNKHAAADDESDREALCERSIR